MALPGSNWTDPAVGHLLGAQITEVDMADAGMTVVRQEGLLPAREVARLEALPKAERAAEVGRLSRSLAREGGPSLSRAISDGIAARVEAMLEANGVGRDRLLSVKRDAVFVTGPPPSRLRLRDGTVFRAKASHTAFLRMGRAELYCTPGRRLWQVKGMSDAAAAGHAAFSLALALDVLALAEGGSAVEAAATLCQFRRDYVARRLPLGFYREFNARSSFCVRAGGRLFLVEEAEGEFGIGDMEIVHNVRCVVLPLAAALG